MNTKKNILVFPCGSEIALEIHRSLRYSIHFNLYGGSSISDHGRFVFENYIDNIPFITEDNCISKLKEIVAEYSIDAIYPAMDAVMMVLKRNEQELGCVVVSSPVETTEICSSKSKTYAQLKGEIHVPKVYHKEDDIDTFPVFLKPDTGYGSRGAIKANSIEEIHAHRRKFGHIVITEYLPGKEYTVDCFTDYNRELLFAGWRQRSRITNGISVNTSTNPQEERFYEVAQKINKELLLCGAWFFQLKEDNAGNLVLLEIADRLGGSSSVYRQKGINFAYLSLYTAFNQPVSIIENDYQVELDRALDTKYKVDLDFDTAYFDLDDTIIANDKINILAVSTIYKFINERKRIVLITKHEKVVGDTLTQYKLHNLFDEVIHLKKEEEKYDYINDCNSIFIDDSFAERKKVYDKLHIPVFAPDMLEVFLNF